MNCVRWDPSGNLLASCSDDRTVKVTKLTKVYLTYYVPVKFRLFQKMLISLFIL